jgi:histidine triad (HIT) family protein
VPSDFDLAAHIERSRKGPCFVCAYGRGHPDYEHLPVYAEENVVAFLGRYPPPLGDTSVASRAHITDVTGDRELFGRVTDVMYDVAEALKATVPASGYTVCPCRLAATKATPVHWQWHCYAVIAENGVLDVTREDQRALAARVRSALRLRRGD